MLSNIKIFVKTRENDIMLLIAIILISLLSFSLGFITAKKQEKEPIKVEYYRTVPLFNS
ncbi:MAG: hypothetical protein AAB565_02195 [Patescibacteria group bacterium]